MKTFKNVTLYIKSEFMGINTIFCKELTVEKMPYAQYESATHLLWKQPRQRKQRCTVLSYNQTMVILEGQCEKFENFVQESENTQRSKHLSCDPAWNDYLNALADDTRCVYSQKKEG